MVNILYNILLMSISGTIMYLVSLLFNGRKQYAFLRYAMLIAAVALMLIPVQAVFRLPKLISISVPGTAAVSAGYPMQMTGASAGGISAAYILFFVWITGAVFSFARFALKYRSSRCALARITENDKDERRLYLFGGLLDKMKIKRHIELRTSKYLNSPMLFGITKPTVIIPDKAFSDRELEMMMTHELVHYRHGDIVIAFLTAISKCIHWFNPAVHLTDRAILTARELCCDEAVLERIDPCFKKEYGRLILAVIETSLNSSLAYTTSMASSKVSIQRRLMKIIEYKAHSRLFRLGCLMLVCSFSVSALTAFGFEKAAEGLPEEIKQEIERAVSVPDAVSAVIGEILPEVDVETVALKEEEQPESEVETEEPIATAEAVYVPEETVYDTNEEAAGETEEYYFTDNAETAVETNAEEYAEADEPLYKTISLAESSFMFKPDFSVSGAARSDNFEVPAGMQVSIVKYSEDGTDLRIEVYDAETDELFTGETEATSRKKISFMRNMDKTYYIIAYCTAGVCDGIYVSGKDMYR